MAAVPFDDVATLRAALARAEADAARTKAVNADLAARIALLELQNEKMRRALFGRSAERGRLLVDQLELGFEELETTAGEEEALAARVAAETSVEPFTRARPSRKPLPAHLPARARRHDRTCPLPVLRVRPAVKAGRGYH